MGLPQPVKRYTPAEYYELENAAHYKSDYYKGEIFNMSGGSARHSLISLNIGGELGNRLKGKPCTAYASNLRLKVTDELMSYPDAAVYCDRPILDPTDMTGDTATNPTVIFEVLSPTTEAYDRGAKAEGYRTIATLKAYALVSQFAPRVELHERGPDGAWRIRDIAGLDAAVDLPSVGVTLPLADVYDRVEFDRPPGDGKGVMIPMQPKI